MVVEIMKNMKLAALVTANTHNAIAVLYMLAKTKVEMFMVSIVISPNSKWIFPVIFSVTNVAQNTRILIRSSPEEKDYIYDLLNTVWEIAEVV